MMGSRIIDGSVIAMEYRQAGKNTTMDMQSIAQLLISTTQRHWQLTLA